MSDLAQRIKSLFLALLPADGASIGNSALRQEIEKRLAAEGLSISEEQYRKAHAELVASGDVLTGKGRGGSVRRAEAEAAAFDLAAQVAEAEPAVAQPPRDKKGAPVKRAGRSKAAANEETQVLSYRHQDKRKNNPEVGMVTPATDPDAGKTRWAYDPHIDPALNFDSQRGQIEQLVDDALESGDADQMRQALETLKRMQAPYLNWAGKAERTSFDIDTVSLHVHERIDPASILSAVRKIMKGEGKSKGAEKAIQPGLFDAPFESLPLRDAIDFYRHERGWANRLVSGDSLLVMNSLLQKESMAGRVQMIYIDPPYGVKYGSNFQPFVGEREVEDRKDKDLTQEPEMIKAFRDTWELGIHSYLTYLRDRLYLSRKLLSDSGSVFVQISDENHQLIRNVLDEIFGVENFVLSIVLKKKSVTTPTDPVNDFIVWYAKDKKKVKVVPLIEDRKSPEDDSKFNTLISPSGQHKRALDLDEQSIENLIALGWKWARVNYPIVSQHPHKERSEDYTYRGLQKKCGSNKQWRFDLRKQLPRLDRANRIFDGGGESLGGVLFWNDWSASYPSNIWSFHGEKYPVYVVQTTTKAVERCLLMTTDPGDLVLDPTCGSGTTAFVAEKWGRRWITCDTSRVAVTLAKQRLMTASYDYYELKYPHEGLKGGFIYNTVSHVTLKSIADNPEIDTIYERLHPAIESALAALNAQLQKTPQAGPFKISEGGRKGSKLAFKKGEALQEWEVPFDFPDAWHADLQPLLKAFHDARQAMQRQMDASIAAHADQEVLYDQPAISKSKLRITGPFTVEAVPFPSVKSLDEASGPSEADASIARTGESGRQHQWLAELQKTGIRGKGGQMLKFADLESLPYDKDLGSLHATGHLDSGERVVVSFGPEHAALEQRQVANALNQAGTLFPLPKMIVFCAFTFDPEAAKDIDSLKGITALKAQMNTDLLTEDLKKARSSNQSFWLMGQPEVEVRQLKDGQYQVEVHGFDYFDTVKGELVSGGKSKIAMWSLDTDYDERSLFPRQVFFPMAGKGEGWEKLKKNIRAELDESRVHQFHGTVSLPFDAGDNRKIAVKIVDDRGIESLKVMTLS